ncbi:Flagellar basal body rod protein FlgB [Andreprevotia sp. IGB-42]|uniref:flagellar basal body rod protein FlgB n=1 Tax=Andreprevotia sp. IGB-42 TaxID=2497473 RepID=UPI00135989C3|nr:flagellar basal body rod protein FlgB [Andreprevotia sp. IGB-42]KAF0813399.1 Flagellar basal body rod protein FlgB [Andreprevotia sp. IGB-42]
MLESIGSVTMNLVSKALDAASLRHQAIATNIANVNTEGFQPFHVSFEDQLGAVRSDVAAGREISANHLAGIAARLERDAAVQTQDSGASLDLQTAALSQNTLQYQALLKGVSHHYAILSLLINDGKR